MKSVQIQWVAKTPLLRMKTAVLLHRKTKETNIEMSRLDDPRLADLFTRPPNPTASAHVALLGYPCDEGVARNQGRMGAKHGPEVFRKYLPKIGSVNNHEYGVDLNRISVTDMGDVDCNGTLEEIHQNLRNKVKQALNSGYVTVVVGGGNDQSYPNARGLMDHLACGDMAVINVDAHLDVRPLLEPYQHAHSGSPFRQLLDDPEFNHLFVEFACQGAVCGAAHAQYVTSKGGRLLWLSRLRRNNGNPTEKFVEVLHSFGEKPIFVSFDIDSIKSSDCPGVSAPSPIGLTAEEALDICREAGRHRNVRLMDFSEFNPSVEEDRTARLLTLMFYNFLLGVAERFA